MLNMIPTSRRTGHRAGCVRRLAATRDRCPREPRRAAPLKCRPTICEGGAAAGQASALVVQMVAHGQFGGRKVSFCGLSRKAQPGGTFVSSKTAVSTGRIMLLTDEKPQGVKPQRTTHHSRSVRLLGSPAGSAPAGTGAGRDWSGSRRKVAGRMTSSSSQGPGTAAPTVWARGRWVPGPECGTARRRGAAPCTMQRPRAPKPPPPQTAHY